MSRGLPIALAILAIVAACVNDTTGPLTGTVKGVVSDSAGGKLANVVVIVYPPSGDSTLLHTASDGSWQLNNVPIGSGSIQIESLPPDCDTQPLYSFYLASPGTTSSVNVTVACTSSHQVVSGLGHLDGPALDEVRRRRLARRDDARFVGLEYRLARRTHAPRRMRHVILDRRSVALTGVAPVPLGYERGL
jgi:hypothetical protein